MEIQLKGYYDDTVDIRVEPSERDILYDLFRKEFHEIACLPVLFNKGRYAVINWGCLNCKSNVEVERITSPMDEPYRCNYLTSESLIIENYPLDIIELLASLFKRKREVNDGYSTDYILPQGGFIKILYKKCPSCGAQYLATYNEKIGIDPERSNRVTPFQFYLEEMVYVEFDEELFLQKNIFKVQS